MPRGFLLSYVSFVGIIDEAEAARYTNSSSQIGLGIVIIQDRIVDPSSGVLSLLETLDGKNIP